jgi:hypothetical protein
MLWPPLYGEGSVIFFALVTCYLLLVTCYLLLVAGEANYYTCFTLLPCMLP